jgi:predicted alpha/beta hydrolase family esterase
MKHTILIVSGLGDSGEEHWQSHWLKEIENSQKVMQTEWHKPQLENWLSTLTTTINSIEGPIILVAHSLAVVLIAHWSKLNDCHKIAAALFVAAADVDSDKHTPSEIWNFAPIPLLPFPYPSILVTSSDDPYIAVDRAEYLANNWGSDFINVGAHGHLNSESQLGNWQEGKLLLHSLIEKSKLT